jgi:hypothetical protein
MQPPTKAMNVQFTLVAQGTDSQTFNVVINEIEIKQEDKSIPFPAKEKESKDSSYICDKHTKTKAKLSQLVKNSSLPMWLADVAVDFNPDDPSFFETILKPELEKRKQQCGASYLHKFQNSR